MIDKKRTFITLFVILIVASFTFALMDYSFATSKTLKKTTTWKKIDSKTITLSSPDDNRYSYKYVTYKKGNSIKGKIYGPNYVTGKSDIVYYDFKINKKVKKWVATADSWFYHKKTYNVKKYTLNKSYKKFLKYLLWWEEWGSRNT